MEFYLERYTRFSGEVKKLRLKYNTISTIRLLVVLIIIGIGYIALNNTYSNAYTAAAVLCIAAFIFLMRLHGSITVKIKRAEALANINKNEISYLNNEAIPFTDGAEFTDFKHPYSYDLDVFGEKSMFHNVNRTYTFAGKQKLAKLFLSVLPQQEIINNQEAIKELSSMPEWRQEIMALGYNADDTKSIYQTLVNWSRAKPSSLPLWINIISYVLPVLVIGLLIGYLITGNNSMLTVSGLLFPVNIMLISAVSKRIQTENGNSTDIYLTLKNYGNIITEIESATFKSNKLKALQQELKGNGSKASSRIKQLSELFSRMDTINNLFIMIVFNGFFLFHIHVLRALIKWKKQYSDQIVGWLDVIAETEAQSSFANMHYNNPDFTFPELNTNYKIEFRSIAHPLINKNKRVGNDVSFNPQFIILTGSNMSGKSTFLRSLGINMVLAGIGAPVCALKASVHPLPVLVSMRLSDSLSDSESYFFAEIKRLKLIMDLLEGQRAFVLLDEILRGTNSDDKQTGTIAVIKKMIAKKAIGAIATHDIEVCNTTYTYPDALTNQCFEVQIVNNDLYFDYTLREGICKNKSATFIMDKMGVI